MGERDFDDFIKQQKEKLVKERQALGDLNNNQQNDFPEILTERRKWDRNKDTAADRRNGALRREVYSPAGYPASNDHRHGSPQFAAESHAVDTDKARQRRAAVDQQPAANQRPAVGQRGLPSDAAVIALPETASGGEGLFSGLGGYERKRRALDKERNQEYNNMLNERGGVVARPEWLPSPLPAAASRRADEPVISEIRRQSPRGRTGAEDLSDVKLATLPGLQERLSAEQEKIRQRNIEYNEFLRTSPSGVSKVVASPSAFESEPYEATLPGLRDRLSAEQEKVKTRNAEYNEFLQAQQRRPANRRDRTGIEEEPTWVRAERPPALQPQDDAVLNRPPLPAASRKGWGTPTYDEMLEAKRRQEQAYRRYDDPETRHGMPLTDAAYARNAGSESNISRVPDHFGGEGFQRKNSENPRRVSFVDDRQRKAEDADVYNLDRGGPNQRRNDRREDRLPVETRLVQQQQQQQQQSRQLLPQATDENQNRGGYNSTLLIGSVERPSAMKRKKDAYRQELMAQMEATAEAKKLEKRVELPVNITGFADPGKVSSSLPLSDGDQGPTRNITTNGNLDSRPPLASVLNARPDLYSDDRRGADTGLPSGAGILDRGFEGLFRATPSRQDFAGYQSSASPYAAAGLQLPPPPAIVALPNFVPAAIQSVAGQYGAYQLPPAPVYSNYPLLPARPVNDYAGSQSVGLQQLSHGLASYGLTSPIGQAVQPAYKQQQFIPTTSLTPKQQQQQQNQQQQSVPFLPAGPAVGEDRSKASKVDYSSELQKQIEERKLAKQRDKEERLHYEKKLEAEIAAYNPFGRGGGGAPMKDPEGNTVADRRILKKGTDGTTPRGDFTPEPKPATVSQAVTETALASPRGAADVTNSTVQNFARGGNGVFGEPKTDVQKTATDKYKDELRLQIEDKKRKQEEEKRRLKEEEDREAARLEEERLRIQRDFELEQLRQREKEEEARKKNEDLIKQAGDKKKEAERKAQAREDSEQKAAEQSRAREQQQAAPPPPSIAVAKAPEDRVQENPPVAPTRLKSAEVLSQLAHMRRQLQQERLRVENSLEKQKVDIAAYDAQLASRATPVSGTDAFDLARRRGAPAVVRRPTKTKSPVPSVALEEESNYDDRLGTVPESPERTSSHLESTSSFMLPVKPPSSNSLLDGDTAFIDPAGAAGAAYPEDFDDLRASSRADAKAKRRPAAAGNVPASAKSVDPERITRQNQERLKKLKQIAGDDMSVADPDDIIDRFMARQQNRPASGQTLEDESWLNAGSR